MNARIFSDRPLLFGAFTPARLLEDGKAHRIAAAGGIVREHIRLHLSQRELVGKQ